MQVSCIVKIHIHLSSHWVWPLPRRMTRRRKTRGKRDKRHLKRISQSKHNIINMHVMYFCRFQPQYIFLSYVIVKPQGRNNKENRAQGKTAWSSLTWQLLFLLYQLFLMVCSWVRLVHCDFIDGLHLFLFPLAVQEWQTSCQNLGSCAWPISHCKTEEKDEHCVPCHSCTPLWVPGRRQPHLYALWWSIWRLEWKFGAAASSEVIFKSHNITAVLITVMFIVLLKGSGVCMRRWQFVDNLSMHMRQTGIFTWWCSFGDVSARAQSWIPHLSNTTATSFLQDTHIFQGCWGISQCMCCSSILFLVQFCFKPV